MKLSASLLRPCFFRRRRRRRGVSLTNNPPEPSSPKVTCIGQVRVKSQRKAKQCRRRISSGGDTASFRSGGASVEPSRRRDQRWVHLPSLSVFLHAVGHDFCCFFRCCRCNCFSVREKRKSMKKKKIERSGSGCFEDGRSELFGRWLVAVNGGEDGRTEIEVVVGTGDEEGTAAMTSAESSRRHVFDDIEVIGDRIEVKGRGFVNAICHVPPKNALLLMRCRSDPLKMAAIANRISSDAIRYQNNGSIEEEEEEDGGGGEIESKCLDIEHEICTVAQVLHQEEKETVCNVGETGFCNEEKEEEIEQELDEEEEEEVESNMSSFEALLVQESTKEPTKSNYDHNPNQNDSNKQEKKVAPLPENQETAAAAAALPECLLLMMREPKLSMEVSKETWVCATDFVRLLPERPRKKVSAAAAGHEPVVKKRAAVEKAKPRVPPPPHCKKSHDTQPARSSCSAAAAERKWTSGCACEPLALTRCKSEPMSTAAAKLMPEAGVGAAGVGF